MRVLQSDNICPTKEMIKGSIQKKKAVEELFNWNVGNQVPSPLDAIRKKYIPSGRDCHDV